MKIRPFEPLKLLSGWTVNDAHASGLSSATIARFNAVAVLARYLGWEGTGMHSPL
jgi:hypothetical protein